ncbi:salicylate hydroxylase [Hypoxylon sp. NC1633]|nr:salicylate hydroxylase [Hypoxylon sp. NC1633]
MSSQPRIAIVGGGPAGLTMGLLLQKHHLPFTIFELRQKPTKEELAEPSGMLDLHEGSGLDVIKECGLWDEFVPLTAECSQDKTITERGGKVLFEGHGDRTCPEISRNNLSSLLLSRIPAESVKWGHKLLSATKTAAPGHVGIDLDFGTNRKHSFDFVVGADGAWSKVRNLLTDTKPYYTNIQIVTLTIKNLTKKYPHLAQLVGTGSFAALGNRHMIVSQRGPIDSSRLYLMLTHPDEHFAATSGLAGKPASRAKDTLLRDEALLCTFGASLKELVGIACDEETADHPDESINIRPLYSLPYGTSWEHQASVTLVGDAAHLMLPNGEGVNQAMLDSLLLSRAVIKAYETAGKDADSFRSNFDPLLREYETALFQRVEEMGKETEELIKIQFESDEAGYTFSNWIQQLMEGH